MRLNDQSKNQLKWGGRSAVGGNPLVACCFYEQIYDETARYFHYQFSTLEEIKKILKCSMRENVI